MFKTHDQPASGKASFEVITASGRTAGGERPSPAERSSYLRLLVDAVNRKGPRAASGTLSPIDVARGVAPSPNLVLRRPGRNMHNGGVFLGLRGARFTYSANNVINILQYK
jgi:hypothetical protein